MVTIGPPASKTTISTFGFFFYFLLFSQRIIVNTPSKCDQFFVFHKIFRFTKWFFIHKLYWLTESLTGNKIILSKRTGFVNVSTLTNDVCADQTRTLSSFSMMALKSCLCTNRMRAHIPTIFFAYRWMKNNCIHTDADVDDILQLQVRLFGSL